MKRFLKWLGIAVLALVLINFICVAAIFCWAKCTGVKELQRVQTVLRAKGEKLTFSELVAAPPLDSQNFFADPLWQQLSDLVPHTEKGRTVWSPRLPKEKQLVNQWKTPLTDSELSKIQFFFPSEHLSNSLSRKDAINRLAILLNQSSGIVQQKIAGLILNLESPAIPILLKTAELLKRPCAYFPIRYQDNFYTSLPHCVSLLILDQLLGVRATSELALGQTDAAATDIQTLLKLARVVDNEPILICMLVGEAILKLGIEPLNKGIAEHRWNDENLKRFQNSLKSVDLIGNQLLALHGERACMDDSSLINISEIMGLGTETGLILKSEQYFFQEHQKAFYDQWIQGYIDTLNLHRLGGVNDCSVPAEVTVNSHPKDMVGRFRFLTTSVVQLSESTIRRSSQKTIEAQTQVSQTLIACALERYRIAHKSYPVSLEVLIPDYLETLPNAPTTGKPMNYSLQPDGTFLLWAPGWNLKSLGGKTGEFKGDGDIVWNQKLPTQEKTAASRP